MIIIINIDLSSSSQRWEEREIITTISLTLISPYLLETRITMSWQIHTDGRGVAANESSVFLHLLLVMALPHVLQDVLYLPTGGGILRNFVYKF